MSFHSSQHAEEAALYRQTKAYYAAIRRPWLERILFTLCLAVSLAAALTWFGISPAAWPDYNDWLTVLYWVCLLLFVGADSLLAKASHPRPVPFGPFHLGRIYEKFAMQERSWQLLVILMLPLTGRLLFAIRLYHATH